MLTSDKALSAKLGRALAERVLGKRARTLIGLTDFSYQAYRKYQHAVHLQAIDDVLTQVSQYVETGGQQGLGQVIISMPPRHGKTQKVSRIYPTWHLGNYPDHRVMLVSYAADLATKNSRWVRNSIRNDAYQKFFGIKLADDSQAVNAFNLHGREGGLEAIGIGGGATGKGAHLLIIDDPIKNRAEAESVTYRNKVWDSYTDDLYTRLEPGGAVLVVMTRWHEDDLAGRLIKMGGWHELRLPAIAEENDPIGRVRGTALWEARYPLSRLLTIQATLGEYAWSGLYAQRPSPTEGGKFKRAWFDAQTELPPMKRIVRFWDLAMSDTDSADYTVGVKLGEAVDGHVYVIDVARARKDWADVVPFMKTVILADGVGIVQGIEKKGYMSRAVKDLNRDADLKRYTIKGYPVDQSKVVRSMPLQAKFAAGVLHVMNRHWRNEFVDEFVMFPNGEHDDQVDATAGAWEMLYPDKEVKTIEATGQRYA